MKIDHSKCENILIISNINQLDSWAVFIIFNYERINLKYFYFTKKNKVL